MTCEGRRDILGLWVGDGGEGTRYWLHVLTELKNRGVVDVLMVEAAAKERLSEFAATWGARYPAIMSLDLTGTGRKRWTMRWKPALHAFEIAFDGRLAAGRK